MVAKKGDGGSSKDVLQQAEESSTLKKEQKETKKANDQVVSKSCLNNESQPTETEVKPPLKAAPQAPNALETGKQAETKETKESKVDVIKKRIRTYLKPRVPSFRKLKKAVKGSNVPASRTMMQKRKPPLPKFQSMKKSTKRKMRVMSPRRRVQKARFRRKPPVPRFAICKRRSGALKNPEKQKSSPMENMTGYQRRNKRKPALPDFSGRRKQKRLKIAQGEQKQSKSKILDEKKLDRGTQPAKNINSKDSSISLKPESVLQKKKNPETGSSHMPEPQTKTAKSTKNKAISNTSDASKKSVNPSSSKSTCGAKIRFPSKPSGKSVNSSTGKLVKLKHGLKFPKTKLERKRNANVDKKTAHSQGSGEKALTKSTPSKSKKAENKTLKAYDKGEVDKADLRERVDIGEKRPPAGGGSMQKVPETEQSSTVM